MKPQLTEPQKPATAEVRLRGSPRSRSHLGDTASVHLEAAGRETSERGSGWDTPCKGMHSHMKGHHSPQSPDPQSHNRCRNHK